MHRPLLIAAALLLVSPSILGKTPSPPAGAATRVDFHGALQFSVTGKWSALPEGTAYTPPFAIPGAKPGATQLSVGGCYFQMRKASQRKAVMSRFIDATGARKRGDAVYASHDIKKGFSSNTHFWDFYVPTDEVSFFKLRVSFSYPKTADGSAAITQTIGMLEQNLQQATFGKDPAPKGMERCFAEP